MTLTVECRACKGSGTASANRDYVRRETIQEYCRICHGRGVIEKFTAEQILELAREQARKQDLL